MNAPCKTRRSSVNKPAYAPCKHRAHLTLPPPPTRKHTVLGAMSVHNRTEYFANLRKSYHIASIKPAAEVHILLSDATLCDLEFSRLYSPPARVRTHIPFTRVGWRRSEPWRPICRKSTSCVGARQCAAHSHCPAVGGLERKLDEYKFGLPTLTLQSETAHYLQCKTAIDSVAARPSPMLPSSR